jgi:hypothetical protein
MYMPPNNEVCPCGGQGFCTAVHPYSTDTASHGERPKHAGTEPMLSHLFEFLFDQYVRCSCLIEG